VLRSPCNLIHKAGSEAKADLENWDRASCFGLIIARSTLLGGLAGSRILELHGQRMIDRSF
jgi:hypothetical protein